MSSISTFINYIDSMNQKQNLKAFKAHEEKGNAIVPKDHQKHKNKPLQVSMKKNNTLNKFNTLEQVGSQAGNEMVNKLKYGM